MKDRYLDDYRCFDGLRHVVDQFTDGLILDRNGSFSRRFMRFSVLTLVILGLMLPVEGSKDNKPNDTQIQPSAELTPTWPLLESLSR